MLGNVSLWRQAPAAAARLLITHTRTAAPTTATTTMSKGKGLLLLLAQQTRTSVQFRSGAIKPKPVETPFGLMGVVCAVIPGLFVGAAISKSVANFLEENDLFVPSDDDDDDDD